MQDPSHQRLASALEDARLNITSNTSDDRWIYNQSGPLGAGLTDLEKQFLCAVDERKLHAEPRRTFSIDDPFENREAYIDMWLSGGVDLWVFTRSDLRRYKKMTAELREALPELSKQPIAPEPMAITPAEKLNAFASESSLGAVAPARITPMDGRAADDFRAALGGAMQLGDLPVKYESSEPFKFTKPSGKGIFNMRAYDKRDEDADSDEEEEGSEDEEMEDSSTPALRRTWKEILKDYNDIVQQGLDDEKVREKATQLLEQMSTEKKREEMEYLFERDIELE